MKRLFIALLIFAGVATARAQSTPGYTLPKGKLSCIGSGVQNAKGR